MGSFPALMGAEISPWGWKFHAHLILGSQQAVPIVQGQSLKAVCGGLPAGQTKSAQPLDDSILWKGGLVNKVSSI